MATLTRDRIRRFLLTLAGSCIAIGLTLWLLAPPGSALHAIGYGLAAFWLMPAIVFGPFLTLFHLNTQYKKRQAQSSPQSRFAQGAVVPELAVTLKLLPEIRGRRQPMLGAGQHSLALVVGSEGFTVRFVLPEGTALDAATDQRVDVQFLAPALALPRFAPGTAFRALDQGGVIGTGTVIGTLPRPG